MDISKDMKDQIQTIYDLPSVREKYTLAGKKAFITGSAGGIGRSSAAAMAELGADVVLMDVKSREEDLHKAASDIKNRYGVKTLALTGDVSSEDSVADMYDEIEAKFGTVDVVHSNAGINLEQDNAEIDRKTWEKMLAVNYTGMMLVPKYGAEMMKKHGHGGSIILTASMSGHINNRYMSKDITQMGYNTTKAATLHLTKALALIYCDYGIRVNSISPGYILSGIHNRLPDEFFEYTLDTIPLGRYGRLDELLGAITILATDMSAYMIGTDILIDGGYTLW